MVKRFGFFIFLLILAVCATPSLVDAFSYKRSAESKVVYPTGNGSLNQWEKNNVDSAFYQCVNETSANDSHYWVWYAGGSPTMATFGYQTKGTSGVTNIENSMAGYASPATGTNITLPSASGDVDTLTFAIRFTAVSPPVDVKLRAALYEYTVQGVTGVATPALVDSCAAEKTYSITNADETTWVAFPVAIGYTVDPSNYAYLIMAWAQSSVNWTAQLVYVASAVGDTAIISTRTYSTNAIPATLSPSSFFSDRSYSAYVTYTIPGAGLPDTAWSLVDVGIDTTSIGSDCASGSANPSSGRTDSVQAIVRACHTGTSTVKLYFAADTNGTRWVYDSMTVAGSRTFTNYTSRGIDTRTWTNRQRDLLQLGVKHKDSVDTGDSLLVSWVKANQFYSCEDYDMVIFHDSSDMAIGQVSESETYDDIWTDSLLVVGEVVGNNTRLFLALRNLSPARGMFQSIDDAIAQVDSVFLFMQVDTTIGSPGVIGFRKAERQDTLGYAVNWATRNDDTVLCHSDWDSWRAASEVGDTALCEDTTQWNSLGASTQNEDWVSLSVDTIRPASGLTLKIDIRPWWDMLNAMDTLQRRQHNGLILLMESAEDSSGNHYARVGNVQPFANAVDSTWIEAYYFSYVTSHATGKPSAGTSDSSIAIEDTSKCVVGGMDRRISGTPVTGQNGVYGMSSYLCGGFVDIAWQTTFSLTDTTWIATKFPPSEYVIDSAKLRIYVTAWSASLPTSLFCRPLLKGQGAVSHIRRAVWQGRRANGTFPSSGGQVVTCRTNGLYRLEDRSACDTVGSTAWAVHGAYLETGTTPDIADSAVYVSFFKRVSTPTDSVPTAGDENQYWYADVTEWADSMQNYSSNFWGNGVLIEAYRSSGDFYFFENNVYPITTTANQATELHIWASEVVAPAPVTTTPRNRLKNGHGLKPDERVIIRPQANLGEQEEEVLCVTELQPEFSPYWYWSWRGVQMAGVPPRLHLNWLLPQLTN